jgi:predicted DNA-binding transcriptional regulator AlpA
MSICKKNLPGKLLTAGAGLTQPTSAVPIGTDGPALNPRIRLLRLSQVMETTGLRRTKIYALQAAGDFPMRVQITPSCVGGSNTRRKRG